jgi:hypothetical protein
VERELDETLVYICARAYDVAVAFGMHRVILDDLLAKYSSCDILRKFHIQDFNAQSIDAKPPVHLVLDAILCILELLILMRFILALVDDLQSFIFG